MELIRDRLSLVNAISSMSAAGRRPAARRFLEGLSTDELEYIAAYFGAQLLDPEVRPFPLTRSAMAQSIEQYEAAGERQRRPNRSQTPRSTHWMMILLEYLSVNHRPETRPPSWVPVGYA